MQSDRRTRKKNPENLLLTECTHHKAPPSFDGVASRFRKKKERRPFSWRSAVEGKRTLDF